MAALAVSLSLNAQTADTIRLIDNIFSQWNNATPGVAVAVERGGEVLYNKAFGLANLEYNVPNTTETIFEAGSVSKQFTAAAILLLAKEGKLSLDDDVRKWVPELPSYETPITIQHLITHTSGLKDWGSIYGLTGWPRTTRVYTQELSFDIVFRQQSLNFPPGDQYSYSNSNYVMMVLITERVSGMRFARFCNERLFEPLGMKDTRWRDNHRDVIPGRATAYSAARGGFILNMPFENVHGPGGLLTTTADLLRWNRLLKTHEIFGEHYSALRIEPGVLNSGRDISYAAGLQIGTVNGFDEISHSGATGGYRAWLAYYPEKDLSVALLSNSASFNPGGAGRAVATIFLGSPERERRAAPPQPDFIDIPTANFSRFEGIFFNEANNSVTTIEIREEGLFTGNRRLRPIDADTLWSNGTRYTVTGDGNLMVISPAGASTTLLRVDEAVTDESALQQLEGEYYSYDVDVTYRLAVRDGQLWVDRMAGDSFRLNPVFFDAYRVGGAFYRFERDRRGRITGFTISVSRASNVPFSKIR